MPQRFPLSMPHIRISDLLFALLAIMSVGLCASSAMAQISIPGLRSANSEAQSDPATTDQQPLQKLLEVLKDDAARQKLITELEQSIDSPSGEATSTASPSTLPASTAVTEDLRSLGAQIADVTQTTVNNVRISLGRLWVQIESLPTVFSNITASDIEQIFWLVANLALLILITYGGLFIMRALTDRLRHRLKLTIHHEGWLAKTIGVLGTVTVDMINMLVPLAIGYFAVFATATNTSTVAFAQFLYLIAFLTAEFIMAVLRSILAPNREVARLVSLKSAQARSVLRWCRFITLLLVYGQLLVLPLVTRTLSYNAGRAIGIIGLGLVMLVLAATIWRSRSFIAKKLMRWGHGRHGMNIIARNWHIPAVLYVIVLFILTLARPISSIYSILGANLRMVIAILAGIIINRLLSGMISKGFKLPETVNGRVPLLERRINTFVPTVLQVIRIIVVLSVMFFCLHTMNVLNFLAFIESEFGARFVWGGLSIAVLLAATFLFWLILTSWIEYRINPTSTVTISARERTLLALLRNAFTITLIVITLMFVLSELGINIAPLLASAGVIGLAIGFGAQKLVQDIITGIFIQLEGAIDVGDVVSIGGISGVVERLTIRSASLRDLEGCYHIIPFSSVDTVTNFMRGFSFALLDMGVAYRENIEDAKQAMFDAFEELKQDKEMSGFITDDLEWMGLNSFGASEIVLRARIKTLPGKQWGTKRAYNAIIKRIFDERGIEIPYPHHTLYFGEDKQGKAPPVHFAATPSGSKTSTSEQSKPAPKRRRKAKTQPPSMPDLPDPDAGPGSDR